jgi:hypothetical protein
MADSLLQSTNATWAAIQTRLAALSAAATGSAGGQAGAQVGTRTARRATAAWLRHGPFSAPPADELGMGRQPSHLHALPAQEGAGGVAGPVEVELAVAQLSMQQALAGPGALHGASAAAARGAGAGATGRVSAALSGAAGPALGMGGSQGVPSGGLKDLALLGRAGPAHAAAGGEEDERLSYHSAASAGESFMSAASSPASRGPLQGWPVAGGSAAGLAMHPAAPPPFATPGSPCGRRRSLEETGRSGPTAHGLVAHPLMERPDSAPGGEAEAGGAARSGAWLPYALPRVHQPSRPVPMPVPRGAAGRRALCGTDGAGGCDVAGGRFAALTPPASPPEPHVGANRGPSVGGAAGGWALAGQPPGAGSPPASPPQWASSRRSSDPLSLRGPLERHCASETRMPDSQGRHRRSARLQAGEGGRGTAQARGEGRQASERGLEGAGEGSSGWDAFRRNLTSGWFGRGLLDEDDAELRDMAAVDAASPGRVEGGGGGFGGWLAAMAMAAAPMAAAGPRDQPHLQAGQQPRALPAPWPAHEVGGGGCSWAHMAWRVACLALLGTGSARAGRCH